MNIDLEIETHTYNLFFLDLISCNEDVETTIVIIELVYSKVFNLICLSMNPDTKKKSELLSFLLGWLGFLSRGSLEDDRQKSETLTFKGVFIRLFVGLSNLSPN